MISAGTHLPPLLKEGEARLVYGVCDKLCWYQAFPAVMCMSRGVVGPGGGDVTVSIYVYLLEGTE